jgi:hypothetical protein
MTGHGLMSRFDLILYAYNCAPTETAFLSFFERQQPYSHPSATNSALRGQIAQSGDSFYEDSANLLCMKLAPSWRTN